MAVKGYRTKLFIDAIPMALKVSQFSVTSTVNPLTYNVLQDSSTRKVAGMGDISLQLSGYMQTNDADDLRTKIQAELQSEDCVVCWMLDTGVNNPVGAAFKQSFSSEVTLEVPIDNLITVQGKFDRISQDIHGKFVANEVTVSATGAINYYADFGAIGTSGGDVLLIVSAITGTATDATIIIESDDNSSFTSAATEATLQFSAVGTVLATMSGTIDRYVRARCSDLGGATSFAATVLVGINGITQ